MNEYRGRVLTTTSREHIERILKDNADPKCKRCYGLGRVGFINGIPKGCRCIKNQAGVKEMVEPYLAGIQTRGG
jgi:hypothetical protein